MGHSRTDSFIPYVILDKDWAIKRNLVELTTSPHNAFYFDVSFTPISIPYGKWGGGVNPAGATTAPEIGIKNVQIRGLVADS